MYTNYNVCCVRHLNEFSTLHFNFKKLYTAPSTWVLSIISSPKTFFNQIRMESKITFKWIALRQFTWTSLIPVGHLRAYETFRHAFWISKPGVWDANGTIRRAGGTEFLSQLDIKSQLGLVVRDRDRKRLEVFWLCMESLWCVFINRQWGDVLLQN